MNYKEGYLDIWRNYLFQWESRYLIVYEDMVYVKESRCGKNLNKLSLKLIEIKKDYDRPLQIKIFTGLDFIYFRT